MKACRIVIIGLVGMALWSTLSCGGKKRDAAYYMEMVDSIRKAEQVKEIQEKAGIHQSPIVAWFDTLSMRTLPIKTAGRELWHIGTFTTVPTTLNEYFGYSVDAKLKAMSLPTAFRHRVVLLAEMVDSVNPRLMVYTMNKKYQPIDALTIYEQGDMDLDDDFGTTYTEYYITSKYEITVLQFYQSHSEEEKPELLHSRRYVINKEGKFEEVIIEL